MIRIYTDRLPELRIWYAEQTIPLIHSKGLRPSVQIKSTPLSVTFSQHLGTLSEDAIRDILLTPLEELYKQYDWIRAYVMLCDVTAFYPSFQEKHPGHRVSRARAEYIDQYWDCTFFQEIFQETEKLMK